MADFLCCPFDNLFLFWHTGMKTGRPGELDTQNWDGNDMTCLQVKTTCRVKSLADSYEAEGQDNALKQ